jgi:hypothetical protein
VDGWIVITDVDPDATGGSNVTCVVAVMARLLSELSTAWNVTACAVVSLTLKDARPSVPVTAVLGVMFALEDGALSVTVFPATGLVPSNRVTMTVPVGWGPPLATVDTMGVVVVTVESVAETVRVPNVTPTLWPVRAMLSVVSVAV